MEVLKKKVFYWAPCLNKVGTVISTKNSAIALAKYKNNLYEVYIINVCGEWDEYLEEFKKYNIKIINLTFSYHSYLPKTGFIPSRLSYILIFLISFFPLLFCLRKYKAEFLIMHLITSLPLFLMRNFKIKTKFILRISGMPKLNILRKYSWKKSEKKLFKITCPTTELKFKIESEKIFEKNKICFLQDAIINLDNFEHSKNSTLNLNTNKKIILSEGRLTKQKNFQYLINEYNKFLKFSDDYDLVILGDGEDRNKLLNLIKLLKLQKRVHLIGRVDNVYDYMENSNLFILSSLWEELGFVIVEAAFKNLFIVSSNCPNGPSEFIEKNKGGILFENNKENSLANALNSFLKIENRFKRKLYAKRKSHLYTKFKHHLNLHDILKNENQV